LRVFGVPVGEAAADSQCGVPVRAGRFEIGQVRELEAESNRTIEAVADSAADFEIRGVVNYPDADRAAHDGAALRPKQLRPPEHQQQQRRG